jgi:hypothetical protein
MTLDVLLRVAGMARDVDHPLHERARKLIIEIVEYHGEHYGWIIAPPAWLCEAELQREEGR